MTTALDVDPLLERAAEAAGSDDFGDETFRDGLTRLVDGLTTEAALSDLGRAVAEGQLLGLLRTRLLVQAWANEHVELAAERVEQPLFVVGLSRSGTTALSHLLARDPANRSLLAWEANAPTP